MRDRWIGVLRVTLSQRADVRCEAAMQVRKNLKLEKSLQRFCGRLERRELRCVSACACLPQIKLEQSRGYRTNRLCEAAEERSVNGISRRFDCTGAISYHSKDRSTQLRGRKNVENPSPCHQ